MVPMKNPPIFRYLQALVGVDVADVSVQQARERYQTLTKQQRDSIFGAEFHCVDCCKESILNHLEDDKIRFDLTSCQFVYNYSFDTYPRAEAMLTNACKYLKIGGFFTLREQAKVWVKLQKDKLNRQVECLYQKRDARIKQWKLCAEQQLYSVKAKWEACMVSRKGKVSIFTR